MTTKTLSSFVATLNEKGFTLDGTTDYKSVDTAAKEYFGGAIPNAAIWKVINAVKKAQQQFVEVIDDL